MHKVNLSLVRVTLSILHKIRRLPHLTQSNSQEIYHFVLAAMVNSLQELYGIVVGCQRGSIDSICLFFGRVNTVNFQICNHQRYMLRT